MREKNYPGFRMMRISPELDERLKKAARARGLSTSAFMRMALIDYLARCEENHGN